MVMRLEGWESRLEAVLESARHEPYVLGGHDCFRVACRVVVALTGVDRWPEFCGYKSKRGAMARIAAYALAGDRTFESAGDRFFGSERIVPTLAQRGDIMAVQSADGMKHLGICCGDRIALMGDGGLEMLPITTAHCAWRV